MTIFHSSFSPTKPNFASIRDLTDFLQTYIRIVLPDNGIEYWSTGHHLSPSAFNENDPVPVFGRDTEKYQSVAAYMVMGGEALRMNVAFIRGDSTHKLLTSCKIFGPHDDAWLIARAITEVLNDIVFYEQMPAIVEIHKKLPRSSPYSWESTLKGDVYIDYSPFTLTIKTGHGDTLDHYDYSTKPEIANFFIDKYLQDWYRVLRSQRLSYKLNQVKRYQTPDLPGYVFDLRGTPDSPLIYVLKPGGDFDNQDDFIGFDMESEKAVMRARKHYNQSLNNKVKI